jgi:Uma2 family endonuclease
MITQAYPTIEEISKQIETFPFVESDGEPMDSPWHRDCMMLLIASILHRWRDRDDFYVGGNMFIYFNQQQAMDRDYRGPDFFVVNGGVKLRPERKYWVTWFEKGRYPDVIVELASPSTEREDRTTKFRIYEETFHTHNYFIFDPITQGLDGWELDETGRHYRALTPNVHGRLWCTELDLWIGTWEGEFNRHSAAWLRFYDKDGQIVLTSDEAAQSLAELTKRRAEKAEAEVARLRALLAKASEGNGSPAPSS